MRTQVNPPPVASTSETASDCSQDEGTEAVVAPTHFYLTGFNRFFNVSVNPTQLIIDALPAYLGNNPLCPLASVQLASVLKVSATNVRSELEAMYNALSGSASASYSSRPRDAPRVVFVHLGANMRATRFQLELQACNEATFSCPDEAGWVPVRTPIDPLNTDISTVARTSLDVPALVTALQGNGFDVEQSLDAGRFVCNWTYYCSLKLAAEAGAHVLFVHVPPATVVPINRQVAFIAALLDCIASPTSASCKRPLVSS